MGRNIPGIVILGIAFFLSLLVSISTPYIRVFDIVRTTAGKPGAGSDLYAVAVRLGIWGACAQEAGSGDWSCLITGYAYEIMLGNPLIGKSEVIGKSWTRGLILHPIAAFVTLIAWVLCFSDKLKMALFASLLSFLAAFLTLLAFAIDIALYVHVKNVIDKIDVGAKTSPGPAFWMSLIVLVLVTVSGCLVCFGWRRTKSKESTYVVGEKKPWYQLPLWKKH